MMTRKTIWLVSVVIGIAFAGLLFMQTRYMVSMVRMSREQFANAVTRSLDMASRAMERRETFAYLQQVAYDNGLQLDEMPTMDNILSGRFLTNSTASGDSLFKLPSTIVIHQSNPQLATFGSRKKLDDAAREFQDYVRSAFLYQKEVLNEVVFTVLYSASERRFEERVDFDRLQAEIKRALAVNGITIDYNLMVNTADGRELYRTPGYEPQDGETTFQSVLFRNDPVDKLGTMLVSFPDYSSVGASAAGVMLPSIVFTVVLFITFIVAVWLIFRQKQVAEMRNDFVHNMTHEFKTPLSSISLAAQMLADDTVPKSPSLLSRLSNTIVSESRRLRMQVDKVLQMSLIDNNNLNLKFNDLDIHGVVGNVISIFSLKVQQNGGEILSKLEASECRVYADEMHFTNVIYNLLDNAVKYKRDDVPLHIEIRTYNPSRGKLCISVSDNGRGIKRDDVRHIFERFYRVMTGNQHDVKGFGLGLAYVKAIIDQHHGTIHCDSELGLGTTFTITMRTLDVQD